MLGHHHIGTEHLLLGLLEETTGVAARVLAGLGAGRDRVRAAVLGLMAPGGQEATEAAPSAEAAARVVRSVADDPAGRAELLAALGQAAEAARLRSEVERLRNLLRQHGIDPDGGTAQTA